MSPRTLAVARLRDALLATAPRLALDGGYCIDAAANLLPGIDLEAIRAEFEAGAGSEFAGKFRAPHSSSALTVNTFAPIRARYADTRIAGESVRIAAFEAKQPTGLTNAQPPHLDVIATGDGAVIAIESKCLEPLSPKWPNFSPRYRTLTGRQSESLWFAEMCRLIDSDGETYRHFDAAQMIKHALGLLNGGHARPVTLAYLFWEPRDAADWPLFTAHRAEIARFAERVAGDDLRFYAQSYPELWVNWALAGDPWLTRHVAALRARYDVAIRTSDAPPA